jgi:nitrogen regulatory protein P-II 1
MRPATIEGETMKRIEVIIPPGDVSAIAQALAVDGVSGMTISEVMGWGVRQVRDDESRPLKVKVSPKLKVDMVVPASEAEAIMDRVSAALQAGGLGPAKMFSSSVDTAVHTRSGARDHQALAWRFVAGS